MDAELRLRPCEKNADAAVSFVFRICSFFSYYTRIKSEYKHRGCELYSFLSESFVRVMI